MITDSQTGNLLRNNLATTFLYQPQIQEGYVQVGDVRARYRAAGERGPALVLIHGIGASLESWMFNLAALGQEQRVFAPDVVWFGKSDKPTREVTGEYFAEFITGFMDAVGVERATLVGNSMGGMIAVKTALQYPDRINGLVLVSAAGFGRELSWWLRLRTLLKLGEPRRVSRRMARWGTRFLVHDPRSITDELLDAVIALANEPGSADAYQRVLRFGVDWRGLKPAVLRGIRDAALTLHIPTLIIWGKQDRVIPMAHAEIARRHIPHAQLHIFNHCGHAPMIEKPEEFNALVTQFMKSQIVG